ncbi:protein of unknown function [Pseudotevenvirus RB43]|uniref:DUF8046 domain-containing protein n=2 Tax=Pseudotevenvirus RB43 TaxID=115991 RepID=Q56C17_9CAUD|nr:hypothetical protein RB43ORF031c [Escherichia phage RB43]AAX78553.1 hypothetical protein RB43ORF031c [Escherichia phage RB43]CCK73880.1 protein of unknown function [Pseudotevenvirus RB43]CCL97497.1 protein of unknown function [Pseudotevenvirus RB43]
MNNFDWGNAEMQAIPDAEEPVFDSPHSSKWIVAIDDEGYVTVLSRPNIHDSFFECGRSAEDIGLPDSVDMPPGVYEWICGFDQTTDWETGYVDGWEFYPNESTLLYSWNNGEVNKSGNEETQSDNGSGGV